jgi:hypothetical protein
MHGVLDERGTRCHSITIGHNRRISCSCSGWTIDVPEALVAAGIKGNPCAHLDALYDGRVTEDRHEAKRHEYKYAYRGTGPRLYHVEFTEIGATMFRHRYAAQALLK